MSRYGQLSEKDELIKNLHSKETDNKELNQSIKDKLKALKGNKTIEK